MSKIIEKRVCQDVTPFLSSFLDKRRVLCALMFFIKRKDKPENQYDKLYIAKVCLKMIRPVSYLEKNKPFRTIQKFYLFHYFVPELDENP